MARQGPRKVYVLFLVVRLLGGQGDLGGFCSSFLALRRIGKGKSKRARAKVFVNWRCHGRNSRGLLFYFFPISFAYNYDMKQSPKHGCSIPNGQDLHTSLMWGSRQFQRRVKQNGGK